MDTATHMFGHVLRDNHKFSNGKTTTGGNGNCQERECCQGVLPECCTPPMGVATFKCEEPLGNSHFLMPSQETKTPTTDFSSFMVMSYSSHPQRSHAFSRETNTHHGFQIMTGHDLLRSSAIQVLSDGNCNYALPSHVQTN